MVTADQLIAHAVGDYIIQSDWMATEKTKKTVAALAHVLTYTLPFLLLTQAWQALLFVAATHFVIDRWRLARFVCWAKNRCWPGHRPWAECTATGYPADRPVWLTVWLMIIVDNTMHILCNAIALKYLA